MTSYAVPLDPSTGRPLPPRKAPWPDPGNCPRSQAEIFRYERIFAETRAGHYSGGVPTGAARTVSRKKYLLFGPVRTWTEYEYHVHYFWETSSSMDDSWCLRDDYRWYR